MTPQLRFPEFTDEWQVKKLGDLSNTVNGLTYSPSNIRKSGVLVLRSSNIKHGQLDFTDSVFVDENLRYNESKKGDILICVRNGSQSLIGKNTYIDKELPKTTHGAFMSVLRSDESRFIYQLFQTNNYKKQVSADLGARINSINNAQLLKYKFSFPSKPEQEKIADFLTAVDERIGVSEKKLELLETYKRGVMQKIFTQQIRFKDENGKPYPYWEEKKLGEVASFVSGYTFLSSTYSESGMYKIITIANVQDGRMNVDKASKINTLPGNIQKNQVLERGDILVSMTGNVGRVCKVNIENCLLNQRVGKIVTKNMNADFLFAVLNSRRFLAEMESLAQGGAQGNLSSKDIMRYMIKLPSRDEQQKIADFLTALDDKITAEKSKLTASRQFKKALLQRMFV